MSAEERKQILKMVEDGKVSAEEAAQLMRALDESAEEQIELLDAAPGFRSEKTEAPEFDEVRKRARRWAMIPLWTGVFLTVLTTWGMYSIQQNIGYNFWFYCLTLPLLFGILLITLGAGGQSSRWLYINVDRTRAQDWPRKITFALPLPLGLVSWFLRNFGHNIDGMSDSSIDKVVTAIAMTDHITEPLVVNVDDTDDDARVQIYIG